MMPTSAKQLKIKKPSLGGVEIESFVSPPYSRATYEGDPSSPYPYKSRLYEIFMQIDREFETLYAENVNRK